jgi:hypothetical protein
MARLARVRQTQYAAQLVVSGQNGAAPLSSSDLYHLASLKLLTKAARPMERSSGTSARDND